MRALCGLSCRRMRRTTPKIGVVHYGLDATGIEAVRIVSERPDVESVAAIDPVRAGQDLGQVAGLNRDLGIAIGYDIDTVLSGAGAEVVLHSGESRLTAAYGQILQAVAAKKNVISSCAELVFPWLRYPDLSRGLDEAARPAGVAVLGVGGDPGIVLGGLTLLVATGCHRIKEVRITRVRELAPQALTLRDRVGLGLSEGGFRQAANEGSVGLAGLREMVAMIADALGCRLDSVGETLEPVIARERLRTDYYTVDKSYVRGLRQCATGVMGVREVLSLNIEMCLGANNPRDEIAIEGEPSVNLAIPGGLCGHLTAAATMVNCIPTVIQSGTTGLLFPQDLPVAPYHHRHAAAAGPDV